MTAAMSPAMTFLSTMNDTTYGPLCVTHDGRGKSWLGVNVSDIQPKKALRDALLLLRTSRARRTASVQQTIGMAAAKLLEEIQGRK
jgi:hypothetical protein